MLTQLKPSNMLLLLIFMLAPNLSMLAAEHTLSTIVEIDASAINRYLNNQYNSSDFPGSISISNNGTDYQLQLGIPEIILTTDNAKLRMTFDISLATSTVYHFEIQPSLNIPTDQITLNEINGYLTNLETELNTLTSIPEWIKEIILDQYTSLGFVLYPSKMIEQWESSWISKRAIEIDAENITLTYEVLEGTIKFIISVPTTSKEPIFFSGIQYNQNLEPAVIVRTYDIDVTIAKVKIFTISGDPLQTWESNAQLKKDEKKWFYTDFTPAAAEMYYIWVLFYNTNYLGRNNTFYIRKYLAAGNGYSSNLVGSIN